MMKQYQVKNDVMIVFDSIKNGGIHYGFKH